jgi:hypothetical protein
MSDLLNNVLEAHGGIERWHQVARLIARLSLGGPFWDWKGWPDVYRDQTVTLETRRERITFEPYPRAGQRSVLEVDADGGHPEIVQIRDETGAVLERRQDPRRSFPAYTNAVPWDAIQVAYFTSCATWNYLTAPFVFTYPGVQAREIEPWAENGQTWRRLAVTFPATIANHNPDQVFYFDEQFLQRRMDYQPDVTGSPIAHYTHDPKKFDGFVFYTRRRVHVRDEDGIASFDITPITIDVDSVSVDLAEGHGDE